MKDLIKLLEEFSSCSGPPGGEEPVASLIRKHLKPQCQIQRDGLGSLIAFKEGTRKQPRIMLTAHMDEVGFMLQNITQDGYLRLQPLGGWIASHLPGQRLDVHGSKGSVSNST